MRITQTGHQVAMNATEVLNEQVFTDLGLTEVQMARLWSLLRSFRASAGDFDVVTDRTRWSG